MDLRNEKAKARDKWLLSPEGITCGEGVAQGQWLRNRLERAFCDGWEAALKSEERRGMAVTDAKESGGPAMTAGTGAASPSHSLPAERQERPPSGRDAHQSQLDTVTPTCADCAVHPSYCKNCTDMSGFVTFKEPA